MIEARATVVRVESGRVWVKVDDRQEGCGRCDQPGGCRSIKLAYSLKPPTDLFSLPDEAGLTQGESVVIRMKDGAPLIGAFGSYGLGVVLLLAGAALGHVFANQGREDLLALVGGALGLLAAVLINRVFFRSRRWRGALAMELARVPQTCSPKAENGA